MPNWCQDIYCHAKINTQLLYGRIACGATFLYLFIVDEGALVKVSPLHVEEWGPIHSH